MVGERPAACDPCHTRHRDAAAGAARLSPDNGRHADRASWHSGTARLADGVADRRGVPSCNLCAVAQCTEDQSAARPVRNLAEMGTIENLLSGFAFALQPSVLAYCLAGCVIGTIVGMLPGLGPLAAISLLLPATFGLNPAISLMVLAGVYYGAMYGGSTTSILMRIPGETASVVTCIDGYEMTKRGRSGAALFIAAVGSFVA